jgi:streptogramin lyase
VTIAGLTGNLSIINGTQTAIAASTSPTTFSITATDVYGSFHPGNSGNTKYESVADGTYTATSGPGGNASGGGSAGTGPFGSAGTASADVISNVTTGSPIVQLATVGLCTSSGNFFAANGSPISFVYMNEVSTVATAYTFQPFTLASNNNAWNIGSSGTTQGLLGIQNAALTAAQLYDIQGSLVSTTDDGEGHIANTATQSATGTPNAGNGAVPQNTLDTLANILAACIDSSPGNGGTLSTQCSTLFNTATANGSTVASGDTAATDTATAAINIARYPAGNRSGTPSATYVTDLYGIPTGTVPYAPTLSKAPNDWTIAISYTGGGIGPTAGQSPLSVAVDGSGNIYTLNATTNKLVKFNAFGVPASSTGFGTNLSLPSSVAIDNTSSHVWMANYGSTNVSRFTTAGAGEAEFPIPLSTNAGLQAAALDGSGNIWVTTSGNFNSGPSSLTELNGAGTVQQTYTANITYPYGLAIDQGLTGAVWLADFAQTFATGCAQTQASGGCTEYPTGGVDSPTGVAIDAKGNSWYTNRTGTVSALNVYGAAIANSPFPTGSTNFGDGIAFDGGSNMWVTNSSSNTVFELNSSGAAITPIAGYLSNPTTSPDGIAVDPSGNVWYDSFTAGALYELVGAAQPVVTPLSYAVQAQKIAQKP